MWPIRGKNVGFYNLNHLKLIVLVTEGFKSLIRQNADCSKYNILSWLMALASIQVLISCALICQHYVSAMSLSLRQSARYGRCRRDRAYYFLRSPPSTIRKG